ncbi:MAG: toxin-antitoxin system YwqK family antitoxin [Bacteroidota bacterium]
MKKNMIHLMFFFGMLVLLSLSSCKGDIQVVSLTDAATEGKIEYELRQSDSLQHGFYKRYSPEGTLVESANYTDGELDGERLLYHENGEIQYIERYQTGRYEGTYESFYDDGQKESEGEYIGNAMQGEWKFYYQNGQVKELVRFTDSEENGPFIEYYENGNLKAEGAYLDGDNEHGELKLYDEQGELERIMNCEKGICRTQWVRDTTTVQ